MKSIVQLPVFVLMFSLSYTLKAQTNLRLVKELRREYSTNGFFVARDSAIYTYTADNAFDSVKNDWKYDVRTDGDKRIVRSFDVNGIISNEDYQYFDRGFWWPDKRMSFEYQNRKIVRMTYQEWYGGSWQNLVRYEYTYDAMGNRINELTQVWENAVWQNSARRILTYNTDGLIKALHESWKQNAWQALSLESYTYTNSKLTERLWQIDANGWITAQHEYFFYDRNGRDSVSLLVSDDGSGFDTTKRVYHFNSLGQQDTVITIQIVNGTEQNSLRTIMGYHPSGLIGSRVTQWWNDVSGMWYYMFGSIGLEFQYKDAGIGVGVLSTRHISYELYPIPVTGDQLFIRTGEEVSPVHVSIYTTDGKRVYDRKATENAAGLLQIDTKTLMPGSYMLVLDDGTRHSSRQFVITAR